MPLIDLSYPAGTFTEEARTALTDELTTVLLRAERAPDTEFFRNITWVYVHELPEGMVLAAGLSDADALRVWVLIDEVSEGNWGAGGNVVHFEQLRQAAAAEREKAGEAVVSAR